MNAFAFAAQADGYTMMAAALTLGVAIPALIYALTRVGAGLWIDCHARARARMKRSRTTFRRVAATVAPFSYCRDLIPAEAGAARITHTNAGGGAPAFASSQRLRTVSAVPHWGQALRVPALLAPAAMRRRPDWREEQIAVPTGLRQL
jgi:hypothetical protein